ncbi:MAG: 2-dehydropantoate 2-reductase [Neobacillus sp.]
MKIAVAGTGAVGGYFGAYLHKAGNEVVFLARGNNLKLLKDNGLTIQAETESFHVTAPFTDRAENLSDIDLLLFCVKSTATAEMAEYLRPFLKEECLIMTLQNGVDNEEILSDTFGRDRILSAATYIQANVIEAGVVQQIGIAPRLVIGALSEGFTDKVNEIALIFNAAKIETFPSTNVLEVKWKKLLWNVTFNPLSAVIEENVGAIFEHQALKTIAINMCKEAISVARKLGYNVDENFYVTILEQGKFARNHKTSMLQDKLNGKSMELESICGYLVKKGKILGVNTPVIETMYSLLSFHEQKNK